MHIYGCFLCERAEQARMCMSVFVCGRARACMNARVNECICAGICMDTDSYLYVVVGIQFLKTET